MNGNFMSNTNYINALEYEWEDPIFCDDKSSSEPVKLISKSDKSLLAEFSRQISGLIQFPLSTVYAHAIGCVASAMNRAFYVDILGSINPVNIYIVSSQPPSTGKSGVNSFLSDPIEIAYFQLNKDNAPKRAELSKQINLLRKEIDKDDKDPSTNTDETIDKIQKLTELTEQLEQIPVYHPFFTNATPEALEQKAFEQKGVFNVVSDEAGSILSALGITYGDSGKPANADMVLQGWDQNRLSTIRVSRDPSYGRPRGVFAVLAQDETINSILSQGDRGVGIAERFLICREKNKLGTRDHLTKHSIDPLLIVRYSELVHRLVLSDGLCLRLSSTAEQYLKERKQEIEPELGDFGKYANNVMRGVMGKMDKQVCKLSAIIHASEHFEKGITNAKISLETVKKAFHVYMELTKVYISTSEEKGFTGLESQIEACIAYMQKKVSRGILKVRVKTMLDSIKGTSAWKGQPKITTHFSAVVMPELAKRHICKYRKDGISELILNAKLS